MTNQPPLGVNVTGEHSGALKVRVMRSATHASSVLR
jgi:hypothetical protein